MTVPAIISLAEAEQAISLWQDAWRRLRRNRPAVCGLVVLIAFTVLAALTPWIAPYDYTQQNLELGATPPSVAHWLGTDTFGRDLLTLILYGGRISLAVGFIATAVALLIGVTWGGVAGYAGGAVDAVLMRTVDVLYGFPTVVFVVVVRAVFELRGTSSLVLVIGGISWLTMARIVRGQVLALRGREFVEAARALGAGPGRVLWRHVLPNTVGPVVVYATTLVPQAMLVETFLSFIGLGVAAPATSWGTLVTEGSTQVAVSPWVLAGPGLAMGMTIAALNFLGDGLRDALDPRDRSGR